MSEDVKNAEMDDTQGLLYEQLTVMKKQLRLSRVLTAAVSVVAVVLIVAVVMVVPPAVRSLERADVLLKGLEEADLAGLARSSREQIDRTVDKLDRLDVDSLNKAIQNLENATRPLASLFGER